MRFRTLLAGAAVVLLAGAAAAAQAEAEGAGLRGILALLLGCPDATGLVLMSRDALDEAEMAAAFDLPAPEQGP